MRTDANFAPKTGLARPAVLKDSVFIGTGVAPRIRVDLMFQVLPGVGNYIVIGNQASGVRKVPTSAAATMASPASANFWKSYMGNNGQFRTTYPGGSHAMPDGQ